MRVSISMIFTYFSSLHLNNNNNNKNRIVTRRFIKETVYKVCLLYTKLTALNTVLAYRGVDSMT